MYRLVLWGVLAVMPGIPAAAESFLVDPEAGNNTFTAVFDAALGERITATDSVGTATGLARNIPRGGCRECNPSPTSLPTRAPLT